MVFTVVIGIVVLVCLVSSLLAVVFMRSRYVHRSPSSSSNEKQQIKYSFRPSIDLVAKKLSADLSFRASVSSTPSDRSSSIIHHLYGDTDVERRKQQKSSDSIHLPIFPIRSTSITTNLFHPRRPRSTHWRQGSIVDPNQLALIEFSLPSATHDETHQYRRRSVPILNNIIASKLNVLPAIDSTSPCLLSFSVTHLKTSQIQLDFRSLTSIPSHIHLQQLTIKVKLFPDGKEKSVHVKKLSDQDNLLADAPHPLSISFSNISSEKFNDRNVLMTISGKDRTKKSIQLGQIGKISFNQINQFDNEHRVDFVHEIETMKKVRSNEFLIAVHSSLLVVH